MDIVTYPKDGPDVVDVVAIQEIVNKNLTRIDELFKQELEKLENNVQDPVKKGQLKESRAYQGLIL